MNAEHVKKALEALEAGDHEAAKEVLKGLITEAASGDAATDGDAPGAEGDGAEGVADPKTAESVIDPKIVPASEEAEDEEDDDTPEKKAARKAMRALLCKLTGTNNFARALVQVQTFRASHVALETERQQLAAARAAVEKEERLALVVELVKLGAEFPATVWADATAKVKKLKPRWANLPIVELRSHVADQKAARGVKTGTATGGTAGGPARLQPPPGDANVEELDANGLTRMELRICTEEGCDPKDYAALKRDRESGPKTAAELGTRQRQLAANAENVISLAMNRGRA